VDFEATTQLGFRQTPLAHAFEFEGSSENIIDGLLQRLALLKAQRVERSEWRKFGPVQYVVTPSAADTRQNVLITQVGGESTPRVAREDNFAKRLTSRLGSKARQRTLVVRCQYPPRGFSVSAVLPHEDADALPADFGSVVTKYETHC
jgi:predicted flavoprotein YhiN